QPDIEEPALGRFEVIAYYDPRACPSAPRQGCAAKRCRLESDQQRQQRSGREGYRCGSSNQAQPDLQQDGKSDVTDGDKPQPMPQHPERTQQECPKGEAVARE